jgi:hypothetical protein
MWLPSFNAMGAHMTSTFQRVIFACIAVAALLPGASVADEQMPPEVAALFVKQIREEAPNATKAQILMISGTHEYEGSYPTVQQVFKLCGDVDLGVAGKKNFLFLSGTYNPLTLFEPPAGTGRNATWNSYRRRLGCL